MFKKDNTSSSLSTNDDAEFEMQIETPLHDYCVSRTEDFEEDTNDSEDHKKESNNDKQLRKEIYKRSKLRNKYCKNLSKQNTALYKKQRNKCVSLRRRCIIDYFRSK